VKIVWREVQVDPLVRETVGVTELFVGLVV